MTPEPSTGAGLAVLAMLGSALAAFKAFRDAQRLEAVGWLVFGVVLASASLSSVLQEDGLTGGVLLGLAFAVGLPLMWANIRRRAR